HVRNRKERQGGNAGCMTETSGSIKEGKEGRMGKIIGSKASGNREKEEIKQGWLRVGEQAYAWWNKSAEERAIITEKQRATRKERFVKNGRLPEIKRRQGERYRATVAAKTEEERRAPIEMQKACYKRAKSVKKMVDAKANKSEEEKLSQHLRTKATWTKATWAKATWAKATWAKKSKEDMQKKIVKTAATIKSMSVEDRKASLALTEVKKKATAAEKE
ncbi:hypothetical protein ACHAPC_001750, partial [Botrytis cinerea]